MIGFHIKVAVWANLAPEERENLGWDILEDGIEFFYQNCNRLRPRLKIRGIRENGSEQFFLFYSGNFAFSWVHSSWPDNIQRIVNAIRSYLPAERTESASLEEEFFGRFHAL